MNELQKLINIDDEFAPKELDPTKYGILKLTNKIIEKYGENAYNEFEEKSNTMRYEVASRHRAKIAHKLE